MKFFCFLILYCLAINIAVAQKKDTVTVIYEVKNIENFSLITFNNIYESNLPKGQFKYAIDEPTRILFYLNNDIRQRNMFFLEGDTVRVVINSSASNVHVLNSTLNSSSFFFKNIVNNVDSLLAPMLIKLSKAGASEEELERLQKRFYNSIDSIEYLYAIKNTSSFLSLKNLKYWLKTNDIDAPKLLFLYNSLDTCLHKYPTYKICTDAINKLNKRNLYTIGDTIKTTLLKNEQGQETDLKKLLDTQKFTYLDFWSSCGFSRSAHKNLKQVVQKYKKNVTCISICGEQESDQWWQDAIKEDAMTWKNLKSDLGELDPVFYNFNVHSFPKGVLINKKGVIVELNLHPDKLEEVLKEHLAK